MKLKIIYHWVTGILANMILDFQIMLLGIFSERVRVLYTAQYYPKALTTNDYKLAIKERLKPIKFYLGSMFNYNDSTYVLTKDINDKPHFDKIEIAQEKN